MLTLYQFPTAFGLPISVSPYCAKVELYLRLTGHEYQTAVGNVLKSPNKLVPYVAWPDGRVEAESDAIIARLEAEGPALDEGLSDEDAKLGRQLQDASERWLYFACLYTRFATTGGWAHQRPTVKSLVPWVLAPILTRVIRRSQVRKCEKNGFTDESRYEKAVEVVERLSTRLAASDFLLGDRPRTADCAVWANLAEIAHTLVDDPVRQAIRGDDAIQAYIARLAERATLALPAQAA